MMLRLKWYLDPPSPHQLKNVKVGPLLTKLSGSAHETYTPSAHYAYGYTSFDLIKLVHVHMQLKPKIFRANSADHVIGCRIQ